MTWYPEVIPGIQTKIDLEIQVGYFSYYPSYPAFMILGNSAK